MPTRKELKGLAKFRLKEVESLFDAGLYEGTAYLCGYVVKFALKARICKLLEIDDYPDSGRLKSVYAVHDLEQLLLLAGLRNKLGNADAHLQADWSIVKEWNPEKRYRPSGSVSIIEAERLLNAVRDNVNGVLKWIMKYW